MLTVLTSPIVKLYIANALPTDYQEWLSKEILSHPLRFPEFMLSGDGVEAFRSFVTSYRKYTKPKVELKPKPETATEE